MQIIVNCVVRWDGGIVMIKKPRRGWWFLPGGKVEPNERWFEAAYREVREETGLTVEGLSLRGIHLLQIEAGPSKQAVSRTIAQFTSSAAEGALLLKSKEGIVSSIHLEDVPELPMDAGDKLMLQHSIWADTMQENQVFFGKFTYTSEHELVSWQIDPGIGRGMV